MQYTVSRHWASPHESAEFPTSVKEVVAMVARQQDPHRANRSHAITHTIRVHGMFILCASFFS
jgi:hypothetical protein